MEKIEQLNVVQRNVIVALGFGHLLDLMIKEVPQKITYFALDNFDCDRLYIHLHPGDRRLHVDEDDVYLTLGLPKDETTSFLLKIVRTTKFS